MCNQQTDNARISLTFLFGSIFGLVAAHAEATSAVFSFGHVAMIAIATIAFYLAHASKSPFSKKK